MLIEHNIDGQYFKTRYAHMYATPFVTVGEVVQQGQVIGGMGSTGNSTGPHLHFEIYEDAKTRVNPRKYIDFPSSW